MDRNAKILDDLGQRKMLFPEKVKIVQDGTYLMSLSLNFFVLFK